MSGSPAMTATSSVDADDAPVCPVCAGQRTKQLHSYDVETAARHFCTESRNPERHRQFVDAIGALWSGGVCDVVECLDCGFGFAWPYVGGDETFYRIMHAEPGYVRDKWDFQRARELGAKAEASSAPRALDIGAGHGFFLDKLPDGWTRHAIEGSDVNRGLLEGKGVTVFRGLDDPAIAGRTFDLITAFQVIEHVAAHESFIRQCRSLLAPGGRLVITVPFAPYTGVLERVTGIADMPPNHIGRWTPETMRRVLERCGYAVDLVEMEPGALKTFIYASYLAVRVAAEKPGSLAAQIYKVKSKPVRAGLLMGPVAATALRLLPQFGQLTRGGSFLVVARAN